MALTKLVRLTSPCRCGWDDMPDQPSPTIIHAKTLISSIFVLRDFKV